MHNLARLLLPQEIFTQSAVITDTPLPRKFPCAKTLYQSFRRQRNGGCFPFRGPSLAHPALVPGASHSKQPPFLRRLVHGLIEKLPLGDHIRANGIDLKLRQKDVGALIQGAMNPYGSLHLRRKNRPPIDSRTVFNWENGKTQPSVRFYPAILQFLGYCPVQFPKTIGERIRLHGIYRGFSISEFTNILSVDPTTVGNWERGAKNPFRQSSAYIERIMRLPF